MKNTFLKWIVIGVIVGAAIGTVTHELLHWVVIGIIGGAIIGTIARSYNKK